MNNPLSSDQRCEKTPADALPVKPVSGRDTDFMVDGWRVFKIMAEFVSGFETMSETGPAVTVIGSTREAPGSIGYALARNAGALLAREGFAVITGGGPGAMEAANRGAQEAGGISIGFNISLPNQQRPNRYMDNGRRVSFLSFFVSSGLSLLAS